MGFRAGRQVRGVPVTVQCEESSGQGSYRAVCSRDLGAGWLGGWEECVGVSQSEGSPSRRTLWERSWLMQGPERPQYCSSLERQVCGKVIALKTKVGCCDFMLGTLRFC